MLLKLILNAAALAGIIFFIFSITSWMAKRVVIEKTYDVIKSAFIGTLVVALYFTVILAVMVLFFRHFPGIIRMLLMVVFAFVGCRFFLFLFETMHRDVTALGNRLLAASFGLIVTLFWVLYPNWLTINLGAIIAAITMLLMLGIIPLRTIAVVAIGVTIYDVVAVFGTGQMIALAKSAQGMSLPMMFIIPSSFELASAPAQMLGLGDVVIPGAIIMAALKKSIPWVYSSALVGYFAGLLVALGVVYLTRLLQPATIYLVPGVLLGVVWAAHRAGMLKEAFAPEK